MNGLARLCKTYGRIKIEGVMWVWDYAKHKAVIESEMTKAEFEASERAKYLGTKHPK
jgi:hypothetical protein